MNDQWRPSPPPPEFNREPVPVPVPEIPEAKDPSDEEVVVKQPEPERKPEQPQDSTQFVGLPVRADGDKIFLLKEGKKHWITSAEAYAKLGFKFGDEAKIDAATLSVIQEGEPIR